MHQQTASDVDTLSSDYKFTLCKLFFILQVPAILICEASTFGLS